MERIEPLGVDELNARNNVYDAARNMRGINGSRAASSVDAEAGGQQQGYDSQQRNKRSPSAFEQAFLQARRSGLETFDWESGGKKVKITTRRGDEDVEDWKKKMLTNRSTEQKGVAQMVSRAAVEEGRTYKIPEPKDPVPVELDHGRKMIFDLGRLSQGGMQAPALNTNYRGTEDEAERGAIGEAGLGYVQGHGMATQVLGVPAMAIQSMGARAAYGARLAGGGYARQSTFDILQQAAINRTTQINAMSQPASNFVQSLGSVL